jgi:hypothetical protein
MDVCADCIPLTDASRLHTIDICGDCIPLMCVQIAYHDYQTDEQGWVDTILSVPVNGTVRINTMDWLGQSEYTNTIVFWPALSSAIAKVQKSIRPILVPLRLFNYEAHNLQVEIVVTCLPAMELDLRFSWEKTFFGN